MNFEFEYLKPMESSEPEDQTAQAVSAIHEAVKVIEAHYHDATGWPGYEGNAAWAAQLAHRLAMVSMDAALNYQGAPDA